MVLGWGQGGARVRGVGEGAVMGVGRDGVCRKVAVLTMDC